MNRIAFIVLFVLGTTLSAFSQLGQGKRPGGPGASKLQGLKIEFVTNYLKLTPEEASFWPIYHDYTKEIRKARMEQPADVIATEEKVIGIRKKYRTEFKKVLVTDDRVLKVYTADRDFNNLLKAELQKRNQQKRAEESKQ